MTFKVIIKTIIILFHEGISYLYLDSIKSAENTNIRAVFIQKPERKSTKCHDFSDLNLNDP